MHNSTHSEAVLPTPDLEVRTILGLINFADGSRRLDDYSLQSARRDLRLAAAMAGRREEVDEVKAWVIDGTDGAIPVRVYKPAGATGPLPVIVWFHGGGFILGCLEMADGTCRAIANASGAGVVSVDYRLAPEHDLYAGRRDCIAAVEWVKEHGALLGFDTNRVAVGGDSAGGNLAAVVSQHCARKGLRLALQVLAYPATDLRVDYRDSQFAEGYMLSHEVMEWLKTQIPDDLGADDPWLSPALAESLDGVAPALVITAGCDPLQGDGLNYVQRLRSDGVVVESLHYPGQIHGFITFDLLLHAARDALQRIGNSLVAAFAGQPQAQGGFVRRPRGEHCQLQSTRRKLTELHFDQMVLARLLLDTHETLLSHFGISLARRVPRRQAPLSPAASLSPGIWPQRFQQAIGDIR